jgi:hypothetical protein
MCRQCLPCYLVTFTRFMYPPSLAHTPQRSIAPEGGGGAGNRTLRMRASLSSAAGAAPACCCCSFSCSWFAAPPRPHRQRPSPPIPHPAGRGWGRTDAELGHGQRYIQTRASSPSQFTSLDLPSGRGRSGPLTRPRLLGVPSFGMPPAAARVREGVHAPPVSPYSSPPAAPRPLHALA